MFPFGLGSRLSWDPTLHSALPFPPSATSGSERGANILSEHKGQRKEILAMQLGVALIVDGNMWCVVSFEHWRSQMGDQTGERLSASKVRAAYRTY
jgi:hypothetical protein